MQPERQIIFPPFRLDALNQRLWREDQVIPLRPKSFAVLRYLVERRGRLVSKQELLEGVWPDTSVHDAALKVCVREIRAALGDDNDAPRFIETAHRRGYRFIAKTTAGALTAYLTSFIGREPELAEVKRLLRSARLLTLTGAGGTGKTRLAAQIAADLIHEIEDGVWWVELASLTDPSLVPQAVAAALGVREQPGRALVKTLADHLRARRLALILDNCEQVIVACARLADELLRACPELKILATSREALNLGGEVTWLVPTLSAPDPNQSLPLDELKKFEAARLFIERACAALPDLTLTTENAPAIAQICHRLDGLPLAIELAAARVKALTVEQIAARLDNCFRLLTEGSRVELPRHQTLRAAIDWSYDLLEENERVLLRRLSVFAGGFTLRAVEATCAGAGVESDEIFDLLSRLIDKSLVVVAERSDEARYRLLETMRQYARDRLLESQETAAIKRRHASFYLGLAEEAEPKINTAERSAWLKRLESDQDNLRASLTTAAELREPETGLRMAGAIFWFWFHRGYWNEGRGWSRRALESPTATERTKARAKALFADGVLAWAQGDHGAARARLEESAAIWRENEDRRGLAHTLHFLAMEMLAQNEHVTARSLAEESVAFFRKENDRFGLACSLASLGIAAQSQEDYTESKSYLEESVAVFREIGDDWGIALPLRNLGIVAIRQGDYNLAVARLKESLLALRELREKWFISRSLETLAGAFAQRGDCHRAARLFGAAEMLRETVGASVLAFYRADYERGLAALRAQFDEETLVAEWAKGRAMTVEEALEYAMDEPSR